MAWQQFKLDLKPAKARSDVMRRTSEVQTVQAIGSGDAVRIEGTNFSATFSRAAGTLRSLKFAGHEMLAAGEVPGPMLQLFRAPTDNDKGFGKWLARDWREAGLSNLVRHVESFDIAQINSSEIKVVSVATSQGTNGGCKLKSTWLIRGDGVLELDDEFTPFGELPLLPRVGVVLSLAPPLEHLRWLGRGPWENYSDRQESADVGVWSGTVAAQYVSYVRPQENGNKEDVRWVALTDASGNGVRISSEGNPFSFSALHFTAGDLASVRHNYELQPRSEIVLSLDAKMSGLGNSSCGPGVLARHAVSPQKTYRLRLRLEPWQADY